MGDPMNLVRELQQALYIACGKGSEYWKTLSGGGWMYGVDTKGKGEKQWGEFIKYLHET